MQRALTVVFSWEQHSVSSCPLLILSHSIFAIQFEHHLSVLLLARTQPLRQPPTLVLVQQMPPRLSPTRSVLA